MSDWDVVGERAAPQAGAGGWDVVEEAPFLPVQQKRQVGAGEAFIDDLSAGSSRLGRDVIAAVGAPLLAVDAVANKFGGEETGLSEWYAKNVFGPYQGYVEDAASKRAETERSLGAEVAGAGGSLVTMLPEMVAGNRAAQAMKVAEGTGALGQLLTRAFAGAQPMSAHAGVDRYADAKAMGADGLAATNAALGTYANMTAQGMAPMGATGGAVKRAVTGAAVNPVLGAAGRSVENMVNTPSGDARLQQQVVSPEQAIIDAILGAGMHGVMGEASPRAQTADAVVADRAAYDSQQAAVAEKRAALEAGWQEFGPLLEANGIKIDDPRAETVLSALAQRKQAAADQAEAARQESPPSPEEQALQQRQQLPDVIPVDGKGRADVGDTGVKAGMMSAEGEKAKTEKQARQAFDLAARRQRQADADLATRGEIDPDYQGGGAAARGGEFDSGVRRVTLLDGELPIEVVSNDGKRATVSIDQNGKTFEFEVEAKRLSEHDLPNNQRMAQDYRARSDEPAAGVGVETMAGENMPRRSTDRIAGDEIGGRATPYDPRPLDGGTAEGTVLPPDAGTSVADRGTAEGRDINGEASRPTAGFEQPTGQRQLPEPRRAIEDKNRFTVDSQGRAVDRENRVSGGEGKPLERAPEVRQDAQETPPSRESAPVDTDAPPRQESAPVAQERSAAPQPTGSRLVRDPLGSYHEVTMSDGSLVKIARSDPASDGGLGAWHIDLGDTHHTTRVPGPSQNGHISTVLGFNKAEAIAAIPAKLAQMERYRRAPSEQPGPTVEQRAKDPETLAELQRMAKNAGWAEEGGKLLRDENGNAAGRTQWVPHEPWFAGGMGEKNVRDAVARVEAGQPLSKKQRSVLETMLEFIDENDVLGRKAQAEENRASEQIDQTPQHEADYDLFERALLVDRDGFYRIIEEHANSSPDVVEAALRRMIDGEGNQHAAETARGENVQGRADGEGSREGSRPTDRANEKNDGAGQSSADAGDGREGFSLDNYSAEELRAEADSKAKAEEEQRQQSSAAEAKAKADAERNDFDLTGSDRPADANPKQSDLLDGPNKLYDIGGFVGENIVKTLKGALGWTEKKIGDVLHKVTDPVFSTVDGAPSAGLLDYLNRKLADNFAYVEKVQKEAGRVIEEAADAVLAHRLLSGKTGDRLRVFDETLMKPLHEAIKTASKNKGITLDDINDFLYARHAPERNRQIARINKGKLDGSGITDQQARDTLAKFDKDGKTAALTRIAAEFDKITAFERKTLADAKLIDAETLANWQQAYKHYAPLKGEEADSAFSTSGGSSGFGSTAKYARATGRFDKATNLIERAMMNAQVAVIRAEKAEVGRAFLKFVTDSPNKAIVESIDRLPNKAKIRGDGSVGYAADGLAAMSDRVMRVVDRNGEMHTITFANNEAGALLARALNGMGAKESNVVVKAMSKISRVYSSLQTKWNPEFVVTNALRDVQTAIGTVGSEFGQGMNKKVLADYRKSVAAIMANESGGKVDFSSKEWKGWHNRFRAAGGETHFVSVDDVAASSKALQQSIESGYSVLHPKGAWRKAVETTSRVLGVVDVVNSSIENALRLSVFKNLVEAGHSEAKAAMAAKEVTVNFNRHGEAGPAINAMYVFFNAAVQGQLRTVRMFKDHPKQAAKFAATLAGIGGALATMNYMASGEDEDGRPYYDKVPTEIKNRWAVMMVPDSLAGTLREYAPGWMIPSEDETAGQLYLKLFPMAYGMNMFYNTGAGIVEASQAGSADLAREILAKRTLATVIDSFNPLGSNSMVSKIAEGEYSAAAGELGKLAAPTVADPFVELMMNSNFMDAQIYKEQEERSTAPKRPNSEVAFKKTSDTSKAIARWINSATGGDDLRAGGIDISADKLDYVAGYVTGGTGRFLMNLGKTVGDAAEGKTPDYKRVPFARLVASDARGAPYEHFNDAQHEVQLAAKERGLGRDTNLELAALSREEKAAAAFIKEQRSLLGKVQGNSDLSDDEIHEREQAINRRIESRMKQFLGRYYEAGGKKRSY